MDREIGSASAEGASRNGPLSYKVNPWVLFLRQYGPVPRNDNMYDESIQRALRRSRTVPIEFRSPHIDDLLGNFRGHSPKSVILTGTAGDGKTFLCRKVWQELGGDLATWDRSDKIRTLAIPDGRTLIVIKDLSELKDEDRSVLSQMAEAVTTSGTTTLFLLAANDGQLIEAWNAAPATPAVETVRAAVEEMLVNGSTSRDDVGLLLFNLSRTSAASVLDTILDAVVQHPGWQGCGGCRGQLPGRDNRCPIWENYQRLQDPVFRRRLHELLELCDHNEHHLPIRQLLLLIANTLLGHPKVKDTLLRCMDVPGLVESGRTEGASPYRNVFGENLSQGRQEAIEVFEVLGRFGVGEETSNRIDNVLIYGSDDMAIRPLFDTLVKSDAMYGVSPRYLSLQAAYLEGDDAEASAEFLQGLEAQRQRLFFTLPQDQVNPMRLWDLTVFHFAGEYLEQVWAELRAGHQPPRHVIARLVRGMNRVFSGMLTTTDRQLVLATSGNYSQARVSRIEEAMISVEPSRGQRVTVEIHRGRLNLAVYLDRDLPVRLPLHLIRYEFLSRVAEGALPSSFSKECYEDLLAFKCRLLRDYRHVVEDRYGEQSSGPSELNLKLLQLDTRGAMTSRPLEVRL